MKKLMLVFALVALFATNSMAQAPWKVIDMEFVTKHGSNCSYDDETCTATFKGGSDRWFDLPGLSGDLTQHAKFDLPVLKSNVMLSIHLRYKDANGKAQQEKVQTFYASMNKELASRKVLKVDLTNKGKTDPEILKNVDAVRISMSKAVGDGEEPWFCQFEDIVIK